jgi:Na+-transporting methylmalonyl-CoA/oxaloacetate decarboxylase gamma subunit
MAAFSKMMLQPLLRVVKTNKLIRVVLDAAINTLAFHQFAYIAKLQPNPSVAISIYVIGVALQTSMFVQYYYINVRDANPDTGSFMTNPTTCIVLYILITFATNMGSVYSEFEYREQQAKEKADREAKEAKEKADREAKEAKEKADREAKHEYQMQLIKDNHEQTLAAIASTHGHAYVQSCDLAAKALDNYNKNLFKKHREMIAREIIGNIDKLDVMEHYDPIDHATAEELKIDSDL